MFDIILILAAGILLGWLMRRKQKAVKIAERLFGWSVYILLFLLGIGIGASPEIIRHFPVLGLQAAGISILSIAGSIVGAMICYRIFFSKP